MGGPGVVAVSTQVADKYRQARLAAGSVLAAIMEVAGLHRHWSSTT